jgi:hypothetical protein
LTYGRFHHHLVRATVTTVSPQVVTSTALERPPDLGHLLIVIVDNVDGEATLRAAALTLTRIRILECVVALLTGGVANHKLGVCLPACESLEQRRDLLHEHLVDL